MRHYYHTTKRRFMTAMAGIFPTYALQNAIAKKEGVKTIFVAPYEAVNIDVRGVCTVTINED